MPTASDPRRLLLQIFSESVQTVNGAESVRRALAAQPLAGPAYVLAMGKAACAMARGAHDALGAQIADALVVTKRGYAEPVALGVLGNRSLHCSTSSIPGVVPPATLAHPSASLPWPVIEAGHPLPDAASLAAGERLDAFVARVPEAATVLVLLSGGASALIEQLPAGMALADLQRMNAWLLGAGLDIHAMNAVRKRLSRIKGGRLAQRLWPRPVICLAISDVPGDDPRAIGSGPLTPDPAPLDVERLPEFLRTWLAAAPPLPASDDRAFNNVRYTIVARNSDACRAAARAAEARGRRATIHSGALRGDASATGARVAEELLRAPPGAVQIWGGETTVRLPAAPGRGGRCQTLALAAARVLDGRDGCFLLAAGTDGSDGPGEDAGALVDGATVARAALEGFDAALSLAAADAGTLLEASGDLIQTGATGTNVMDLVLGLRL